RHTRSKRDWSSDVCSSDLQIANKLSSFLNTLATKDKFPKTVLYSLNANDYDVLASMAGNFQNAEVPGKVQFGTAWWFNDTIDGKIGRASCREREERVE